MSRVSILTDSEKLEFDSPPVLPSDIKPLYFNVTKELENTIKKLRTPTNKAGFLLQYGYFKACKRFFVGSKFHRGDIEYVTMVLGINFSTINLSQYKKKIPTDHQVIILKLMDYKPFDEKASTLIEKEIAKQITQFSGPKEIFTNILGLLDKQRTEIPSYHRLSELISRHYLTSEDKLVKLVSQRISISNCEKLDALLNAKKERARGTLSNLTIINQSIKPKAIQASLNTFHKINTLFKSLLSIIETLGLAQHSCSYYATWIAKAKLSQIKQFPNKNKMYLYLIAFIQHQFYLRQDALLDIFLKCVQSCKNKAAKHLDEADKLTRGERRAAVKHLSTTNRNNSVLINEIARIVRSTTFTDRIKIKNIASLLDEHEQQKYATTEEKVAVFEKSLNHFVENKDYFDALEKLSIKLQHRVAGIAKALIFNEATSNTKLIAAIDYFKNKNGQVDCKAPCEFLKEDERNVLINDKGQFRVSLYKAFLFIHMAHNIKSGDLNLKYSYRYLSIQEYLIDKDSWLSNRDNMLKEAGLEEFKNYEVVINELKRLLDEKYKTVNQRYVTGKNPYLSIGEDNRVQVNTPPLDNKDTEYISALLDQGGYIPILRVLSETNQAAQFSKCFKHHSVKNAKRYPRPEIILAGIIGFGCNIGILKMAQISTGVNENTLSNVVNWYFDQKNLHNANQKIVELIHKLELSTLFIANKGQLHGSSDGRKVNVAIESLLANYSFKYFGREKGVSIYTFIDERQALFHSLVMSSQDREAAYVIDGLNDNNVSKVNIHSTDTHGYTELIFAATHLLGISFAPRLKRIGKQTIYAFSGVKTYEKLGYKILPSRTINQKLIENHWDDVLRFMTTIKLKKATASQLFKRLSSYDRDNPLYKALKEFGRIIKSLFILTYFDDVKLRQRVEKQLNRIELSNKFSNAVFYANGGEFTQGLQDEQETAVACKVLIQNAIVLWNYLYLSQLLTNCHDLKERDKMINLIKEGSVICWKHINLHGEFDFRRQISGGAQFDIKRILSLKFDIKV